MVAERGPVLESASLGVENVQQGGRDAVIAVTLAESRTIPRSPLNTCQVKGKTKKRRKKSATTSEAVHKDQPCVSIAL